jgi:hypothetical protein
MNRMTDIVYNLLKCSLRKVQSVDQLLDQQLTRPEKEPEEKVAEDKITFLNALQGLGAARKYVC